MHGHIEYLITYKNNEQYTEQQDFYSTQDLIRLTSNDYCVELKKQYKAKSVVVNLVYTGDEGNWIRRSIDTNAVFMDVQNKQIGQ